MEGQGKAVKEGQWKAKEGQWKGSGQAVKVQCRRVRAGAHDTLDSELASQHVHHHLPDLAIGERTVILLASPFPSMLKHLLMGEGVQQNGSLADGCSHRRPVRRVGVFVPVDVVLVPARLGQADACRHRRANCVLAGRHTSHV